MIGDDNRDGDQPETSNPTPLVPPPTQQIPHTVSSIKLPILKKGEYDIWAMKMEHYLSHTGYPIWKVIQNGNGLVSVTTDTNGMIKVAMISIRIKKFYKRTGWKLQFDSKDPVHIRKRDGGYSGNKGRDNGRRPAYQDDSKALVTIEEEDIDWSGHVEDDTQNYAMMAYSSSNSGSDNEAEEDPFQRTHKCAPQLDYDDLEQINDDDMEEMDLKW
nr:ribonuclease H-like domain-containing protein [Tanacetum cinerariifolium]